MWDDEPSPDDVVDKAMRGCFILAAAVILFFVALTVLTMFGVGMK